MHSIPDSDLPSFLKYLPVGYCIVNPVDNLIVDCNDRFLQKVGYRREEILGKHYIKTLGNQWRIEEHILCEIIRNDTCEVKRIFPKESSTDYLFRRVLDVSYTTMQCGEESRKYLLLLTKAEYIEKAAELEENPGSDQVLLASLSRSNSFLSHINALLRENQENMEAAFDAGNLGSCGIDFQKGEVILSPRGRSFFGISADQEVTWELLLTAVEPEYHDMVNKAFSDALTYGIAVDCTYSIVHLVSGEQRWIRVVAKVHIDRDGVPVKLFGVVMDITEQKKDDQRKNDFIAMVSHELKTPLTAVTGYIQLIDRKLNEPEGGILGTLLAKARAQMNKMSRLINGFLNVSRLESGKIELNRGPLDLDALLTETHEEFTSTTSSHTLVVTGTVEKIVSADRDKITQVLDNLISNAVKYSPSGTVIEISPSIHGDFIRIDVKDSGMGIAEKDLRYVFDRFYRVDGKISENVSGFGIGLYICREIVQRHGGDIWLKSEKGEGSVFSFTLPVM